MFILSAPETMVAGQNYHISSLHSRSGDSISDANKPGDVNMSSVMSHHHHIPSISCALTATPVLINCNGNSLTPPASTSSTPSPDTGSIGHSPSPSSPAQLHSASSSSSLSSGVTSYRSSLPHSRQSAPTQGLLYNLLVNSQSQNSGAACLKSKLLKNETHSPGPLSISNYNESNHGTLSDGIPHIDLTLSNLTTPDTASTVPNPQVLGLGNEATLLQPVALLSNGKSRHDKSLEIRHRNHTGYPRMNSHQPSGATQDPGNCLSTDDVYPKNPGRTSNAFMLCRSPRRRLFASPRTSSSTSTDSGLDEPVDLSCNPVLARLLDKDHSTDRSFVRPRPVLENNVEHATQLVQLAKKTARPMQARVTELIRQAAQFVALTCPVLDKLKLVWDEDVSIPLSMNRWVDKLSHCWHRLLALTMAESALAVVVVERQTSSTKEPDSKVFPSEQVNLPWCLLESADKISTSLPIRQFANNLTTLLTDLRQANLSGEEYYLLRCVISLTAHDPKSIASLGVNVIRSLRDVNQSSAPSNDQQPLPETDRAKVNHNCMTHLESGLIAMGTLNPYQMANLFCSHLLNVSSPSCVLNRQLLIDLNEQFIITSQRLAAISPDLNGSSSPEQMDVETDESPESCTSDRSVGVNGVSILEQIFDNC